MRWLRLVGSLKLQVSFAEYSLFYRALLQKRPIILRSLLGIATPYSEMVTRALGATRCNTLCVEVFRSVLQCVAVRLYTTSKLVAGALSATYSVWLSKREAQEFQMQLLLCSLKELIKHSS